jgi:hypothetical protein
MTSKKSTKSVVKTLTGKGAKNQPKYDPMDKLLKTTPKTAKPVVIMTTPPDTPMTRAVTAAGFKYIQRLDTPVDGRWIFGYEHKDGRAVVYGHPMKTKGVKAQWTIKRVAGSGAEGESLAELKKELEICDSIAELAEVGKSSPLVRSKKEVIPTPSEVTGLPAHVVRAIEILGGLTLQRFDLNLLKGDKYLYKRIHLLEKLFQRDRMPIKESTISHLTRAFYAALGVKNAVAFVVRCKEIAGAARRVKVASKKMEKEEIAKNMRRTLPERTVPGTIIPHDSKKVRRAKEQSMAETTEQFLETIEVCPEYLAQPVTQFYERTMPGFNELDFQLFERTQNNLLVLCVEPFNSQGALHIYDTGKKIVASMMTPILAEDYKPLATTVEAVDEFLTNLEKSKSEIRPDVMKVLKAVKQATHLRKKPLALLPVANKIPVPRDTANKVRIIPGDIGLLEDPKNGIVMMQLEKENSQGAICVYNNGSRVAAGVVPPEILKTLRPVAGEQDLIKAAHQLLHPIVPSVPVTSVAASHLTAVINCKELIMASTTAKKITSPSTPKFAAPAKAVPASKKNGAAPAKKATAEKKSGTGIRLSDEQTIKIVSATNPYREGTKAFATFELFKKSKTVADVKAKATDKHDVGYLRYSSRDGYIKLS